MPASPTRRSSRTKMDTKENVDPAGGRRLSRSKRLFKEKVDTKENEDPFGGRGSRSKRLLKELEPNLWKDEVGVKIRVTRGRKRSVTFNMSPTMSIKSESTESDSTESDTDVEWVPNLWKDEAGVKIRVTRGRKRSVIFNMSPTRQSSPQKMPSPLKSIKLKRKKSESTESDTDAEMEEDAVAYEKMRQENIRANAAFLTQLGIQEAKQQFRELVATSKKLKTTPKKLKGLYKKLRVQGAPPQRQSLRIQKVAAPELCYTPPKLLPKPPKPRPPPGPLGMVESLYEQLEEDAHKDFSASILTSCSKTMAIKPISRDLKGFLKDFSKIRLTKDRVAKVVKDLLHSIAIHPTENKVLVAAGGSRGRVGFWDVMSSDKHDGVVAYCPHARPVNCLHLPPWAPLKTYSCSYDGSLRCGDFEKGVFDEVYSCPDKGDTGLMNFDFNSEHVMLVSQSDGCVAVVDVRTRQTSAEHLYPCHERSLRTVSIHPVQKHYFVTASFDTTVRLWDLRKMPKKRAIAVRKYSKRVNSAYFSPITGKYILSTSANNILKILDSSEMTGRLPLKKRVAYEQHLGRGLTNFRATWHPAREDLFVVASRKKPNQIQLFNDDGVEVQVLTNPDYLCSMCSLNAIHPSRNIVVGGNSGGRVHVFM